jgi:hypothetical protein
MYLYTTVQVSAVVYKYITAHLNRSMQIHYCSLERSIQIHVMFLYSMVQVSGNVFAYYGSSDQSCICIVRFK